MLIDQLFLLIFQRDQSVSNATVTKINLNVESFDTDDAFDSSTNYRFTVPTGSDGKYF